MASSSPIHPTSDTPWLEVYSSRDFPAWMAQNHTSLVVSTYQTAKLLLFGLKDDGHLTVFERTFNRCLGLWTDSACQTLWMSSLYQLWRLENVLPDGHLHLGHDRLFVPRAGYTTGDLDIHDLAVTAGGQVVFVNTRFSCLATLSRRHSFTPLWKPPFISKLAAEDRCHLNGLAMEAGEPRYVTAVSTSDVADGWRERRGGGGVLLDVPSGKVVVSGLSMPHSPRVYRDRIWLHDSGTGFFGTVDRERGRFEPLVFCPGYLRGLSFVGDYAVMGLSCPRDRSFSGLPLDQNLVDRGVGPRCGLQVVDLRSGNVVHWLRIEGMISELYDVVAMPDVTRPMALGFKTEEIQNLLTIGEGGPA